MLKIWICHFFSCRSSNFPIALVTHHPQFCTADLLCDGWGTDVPPPYFRLSANAMVRIFIPPPKRSGPSLVPSLSRPTKAESARLAEYTRRDTKPKRGPNPTPPPRPRSPTSSAMSSSSNGGKKPAASGGRGGPTIRTLSDLNRGPAGFPGAGGHGSGSDDDEPQEYYTGGEKRYIFLSPSRGPVFPD